MYKVISHNISSLIENIKNILWQFNKQHAYEVKSITHCPIINKHRVQVKITGKGQSLNYYADEVAADNNFLLGFCSNDIRTIVYLATSDKYEALLEEERVKKTIEIIHAKKIDGKKAVQFRDKKTGKFFTKMLSDFNETDTIERLTSQDAFNLGYLVGQEQTLSMSIRLRLITNPKDNVDKNLIS